VCEETKGALDVTLLPLLKLWGFSGGVHRVPTAEEIDAARALTGAGKLKLDEAAGTARLEKGSSVELGAVAKGYAGELVAAELKSRGVRSALLDLGERGIRELIEHQKTALGETLSWLPGREG